MFFETSYSYFMFISFTVRYTCVYTRKAWQVFRWIKGTIKCSIKLIRQICTYVVHTEYTPNNFVCSIKKNLPDATGIPKLINCAHYIFNNFSETSQDLFENSSLHLKWCRFNRPFWDTFWGLSLMFSKVFQVSYWRLIYQSFFFLISYSGMNERNSCLACIWNIYKSKHFSKNVWKVWNIQKEFKSTSKFSPLNFRSRYKLGYIFLTIEVKKQRSQGNILCK